MTVGFVSTSNTNVELKEPNYQDILLKFQADCNAGFPVSLETLLHLGKLMAEQKFNFSSYSLEDHLMHLTSEVAEVYEAASRDGEDIGSWYFDRKGKPEGPAVELADVLLKTLAIAGYYDVDLEKAIEVKLIYNATRKRKKKDKTG